MKNAINNLLFEINKNIEKNGYPPVFTFTWCKKQLDSGKASKELIDTINKNIEKYGYPPYFAFNWCKEQLDSKSATKAFK
jgi:hypothetical protein